MNKTVFNKDPAAARITVERHFDAPRELVWRAWTQSDLLEKWWAPKPYRAETEAFEFTEGGHWLYIMAGPEGDNHRCRADFKTIEPPARIQIVDGFCDEQGHIASEPPPMDWTVSFHEAGAGTTVVVEIAFENEAAMKIIVEMGFEEGFTSALGNLDEYLAAQSA